VGFRSFGHAMMLNATHLHIIGVVFGLPYSIPSCVNIASAARLADQSQKPGRFARLLTFNIDSGLNPALIHHREILEFLLQNRQRAARSFNS
jgi:hypothetical protein